MEKLLNNYVTLKQLRKARNLDKRKLIYLITKGMSR